MELIDRAEPAPDAGSDNSLYEQVFSRIGELSSLPTLAMQIFEIASDPNSDAEELLRLVEQDPVLATRLVRTANSALYGLRRKVNDLLSCIMLLGFKEVRNLSLTIFVANLFRESDGYGTYSRLELWNHSVCTGAVARYLCKRARRGPAEDAYLGGLLHDIGLILFDQYMHSRFCQIIDGIAQQQSPRELELQALGFTHCDLGASVAQKWRFPESLCDAIRYHHTPELYTGEEKELVYSISLANFICHLKGISSLGVAGGHCPHDVVFQTLGIAKDELALLWEDIDEIISRAQTMQPTG